MPVDDPENEGEGSQTAARVYNEPSSSSPMKTLRQLRKRLKLSKERRGDESVRRKKRGVRTRTARIRRCIATSVGVSSSDRSRQCSPSGDTRTPSEPRVAGRTNRQ